MSSQLGGNDSGLVGNGNVNSNIGGMITSGGIGGMGGQAAMMNGMRAAMGGHNSLSMNGRVAMSMAARDQMMNHQQHQQHQQQQDLGSQLLNGLGAVNGFNNLPFDWKPSP